MAIHNQQIQQIEGGFAKEVDSGAMNMLLDVFQKLQYSYPEKSTVRELVSNSIDATREREMARKILTGQAKVEDYYINIEGSEYKDSRFDPSYYDLKWLSDDPRVRIIYREGSALERDRLVICDHGVGLGGSRLMGYFSLGYSTKRLSTVGLGKFGMGAKAALSTGVAFYTVINRYNGIETHWSVSSHRVQSIIPKFSPNGQENPLLDLGNGMGAHYYKTSKFNGVEIIVEVKKHNKQKYIDAVKSQLLYFDHIEFLVESHDGRSENIPVSAEILYEDKVMILSKNDFYSKPHILVNRVNYGLIDFQELELEDKMGNISIKLQPEEVSVTPNREKVIWDDTTRDAIKKRFTEVQVAAEKLLQGELEQTDFMKWLKACISIKNKIGTEQGNNVIARLARLVDISSYAPVYKPDKQFRLDGNLFAGIKVRKITSKIKREGSVTKMIVDRAHAGLSDLVNGDLPVFVQRQDTNWLRDRYMLEELYQSGFITIWLNDTEPLQKPGEDATEEEVKSYLNRDLAIQRHALATAIELKWFTPDKLLLSEIPIHDVEVQNEITRVTERWHRLNKYILSSEDIKFYDTIKVPEHYKEGNKGTEEDGVLKQEAEEKTKEAQLSAEARRKLAGDTILFTPAVAYGYNEKVDLYYWKKLEIPVLDIDKWDNPEVYYSSDDHAPLLKLAAFITRPEDNIIGRTIVTHQDDKVMTFSDTAFSHAEVKLVKVAQNRVKYYRDFKHIHKFFAEVKNKKITMSNKLIQWNTARYVHQYLPKLSFLTGFERFHADHYRSFKTLRDYVSKHYREVGAHVGSVKDIGTVEYSDMIAHIDKVAELQIFVAENPNDHEAIAQFTKSLFGAGTENQITDGCALDMNIRNLVHQLLDYAEPIYIMLNQMPVLTCQRLYDEDEDLFKYDMTEELETEIRHYINSKTGN